SIIATIISTQPAANSVASSGSGPTPPSWCRYRPYGDAPQIHRASQAAPASATRRPPRIAWSRRGTRRCAGENTSNSGREAEVALEGVVPLEVDARDPVRAAVLGERARLGGVDRRARDRAEDRLGERRRVAGRAHERRHLGLDELPDRELALAALDAERDRRALDGDHFADQARQVCDRAAELPGEQAEQGPLLLVRCLVVDEDDSLPGLRDEDVLRDVGGDRHRQATDVDALDVALF